MTEPKKRGRPPGSGKNKMEHPLAKGVDYKVAPLESYDSEKLNALAIDEISQYVEIKEKQPRETPFPSNWSTLSKIDKLQWLTANRKK